MIVTNKTLTVWTIEAPPEQTVKVNRIVDLAMCYCAPSSTITIAAGEMTREGWDETPEFEGVPTNG